MKSAGCEASGFALRLARKAIFMKRIVIIGAITIVVVVGVAVLPNLITSRKISAINACVNNLRAIEGAKHLWAVENRKTNGEAVTWENLRGYFIDRDPNEKLVCPGG